MKQLPPALRVDQSFSIFVDDLEGFLVGQAQTHKQIFCSVVVLKDILHP